MITVNMSAEIAQTSLHTTALLSSPLTATCRSYDAVGRKSRFCSMLLHPLSLMAWKVLKCPSCPVITTGTQNHHEFCHLAAKCSLEGAHHVELKQAIEALSPLSDDQELAGSWSISCEGRMGRSKTWSWARVTQRGSCQSGAWKKSAERKGEEAK